MGPRIDVLTTFPEMFAPEPPGALGSSIPARVREAGLISWHAHNLRDYSNDKRGRTDDRPFGGGPGMVMACQPVWDGVHAVEAMDPASATRILLTPQGRRLDQPLVEELATRPRLLLIAGHYEGIDERVVEALEPLEVSIGDYVLTGGELAALVLIDAIARLQPGALGHDASAAQDSFGAPTTADAVGRPLPTKTLESLGLPASARLLDCPHYTQPRVWQGREVPDPLLSGDHGRIAAWRLERALERTRQRRPDLLQPPED